VLFNSYIFILLYLPIVLSAFFAIGRHSRLLGGLWLFGASLFFYGWWNPASVGLLLSSILFNYGTGIALARHQHQPTMARWILRAGVIANLGLLGYYKYADFFILNINSALGLDTHIASVVLPLGISFFTFTQIAFLVDAYRGEVKETNLIHYGLFITYFPHLIAGPVIHHKEMMPQFAQRATYTLNWACISAGLTIFAIGLLKKVGLADSIAPYVAPVFTASANGQALTLVEAWLGALAYTFQLYFDFSGYSDMAIGLSCMFGVKLPLNFNSPYKSVNIIEFWRRWHITLSRFLRDYLYISLGGNRHGRFRRYINLMATMLLGGLWHGAGWTFVIWGGLHGLYLVINHGWRQLRQSLGHAPDNNSPAAKLAAMTLTFGAVTVAWVFFRAANLTAAFDLLATMAGWGVQSGHTSVFDKTPGGLEGAVTWVACLWAIVWLAPNSQQIMAEFNPTLETVQPSGLVRWRPNGYWLVLTVLALLYALSRMGQVSEFLYFQF
jgi:alginate O-acetyltransferase complex protein AlgI